MVKCNQICPWNYYEIGCKKPNDELCPMSNLATKEKPMTNADRIRAMSDEELATLIYGLCYDAYKYALEPSIKPTADTEIGWIEWLKQPAEV